MADKKELWIVYHIKKEEGREKPFWNRCGYGFLNNNGSYNITWEYFPVGDPKPQFNFQKYVPREKKEAEGFSE